MRIELILSLCYINEFVSWIQDVTILLKFYHKYLPIIEKMRGRKGQVDNEVWHYAPIYGKFIYGNITDIFF